MTEQLDTQGEAHAALSSAVTDFGQRILSDPRMLGIRMSDLLPDLPRGATSSSPRPTLTWPAS